MSIFGRSVLPASVALACVCAVSCRSDSQPYPARGSTPDASLDARGGAGGSSDSGPTPDASHVATDAIAPDALVPPPKDASGGDTSVDSGDAEASVSEAGAPLLRISGWSVRKRVRTEGGADLVLEEVLTSYLDSLPRPMRLRRITSDGATIRSWTAPAGSVLSDFCEHPSGAISAILIAPDRTPSLERLAPDLTSLGNWVMHDPLIASDPHVSDAGALDLLANGFAWDAARVASLGEAVVAVVDTSWNSIIAYRTSFSNGAWAQPQRTLIEPPAGLTPFLPIGGSFDTFGAIVVWFRALLDVDEAGNAYIATWASPSRIRAHTSEFGDGLVPLPADPLAPSAGDSDVLLTKMDSAGARIWSRVVGTMHEDEPYGIRAHSGAVAVVGRARRFPGLDNTIWDPFLSVVSSSGDFVGSRALPMNASGIFLAVDSFPTGGWVLGGSDGWSQNPDGLSVLSYGTKLFALLPTVDGALSRVPLPDGPRHNEIRTVLADPSHLWFGGHEDGPIMHTGDADPSLIVATGVLGSATPVPSP